MQRNGGGMVFDLFRKGVGQSRKAPHMHPHREILALRK
jgi:hypothetical protein